MKNIINVIPTYFHIEFPLFMDLDKFCEVDLIEVDNVANCDSNVSKIVEFCACV